MSIDAAFTLVRGDFRLEVAFTVPSHGITAIFGPSGCGKTTLLRSIAGLENVATGTLRIGDTVWQDERRCLACHQRALGYVFQEPSLFDHLSVHANITYGYKRVPSEKRRISLDQAIDQLDIRPLLQRRPATLSGGERQRVAIARALAVSPDLLLMDEPLASLDLDRRRDILPRIEDLSRRFEIPVLYVSHLPDEVARLAQQVVILDQGRVVSVGPVFDLFSDLDQPLAHSPDASAILETTVAAQDPIYELTQLQFDGGDLLVPRFEADIGQPVRVRIAARDVSLALKQPTDSSILNRIPVVVDQIRNEGRSQVTLRLLAGTTPILSRITRKSMDQLHLQVGTEAVAQVKSVALLV